MWLNAQAAVVQPAHWSITIHAFFDIILIAASIVLLACWLNAEGKIRMVCADLTSKAHKFARREAEFRRSETTWRLQEERFKNEVADLERRLRG